MKFTAIVTAAALLVSGALAAPNPDAKPQICECINTGCIDTCGARLCC